MHLISSLLYLFVLATHAYNEDPPGFYEEVAPLEPYIPSDFYDYSTCETIYVDMGTNKGVQLLKWFWIEHFPRSGAYKVFMEYTTNNSRTCAIGFEPNPVHTRRLLAIEDKLTDMGKNVKIFTDVGVGSENTYKRFYLSRPGHDYDGAGFHENGNKRRDSTALPKPVREVDISELLLDLYYTSRANSGVDKGPRIIVKMDIEGHEYKVIPAMMAPRVVNDNQSLVRPAACAIDMAMVEWHPKYAPVNTMMPQRWNQRTIATQRNKAIEKYSRETCKKTKFVTMDDETYLRLNLLGFLSEREEEAQQSRNVPLTTIMNKFMP